MCKFIWKSNDWILCKLSKSEILRLYEIAMLKWKLWKRQILPVNQNLSSKQFLLAKFQLVSSKLSLAMMANDIPQDSKNKPRGLYFSTSLFEGLIFEGAYIWRGLSMEGNLRFKIDWASLIVGSKFTVFALVYFVFEGNFPL